jgi:hypothetical protein
VLAADQNLASAADFFPVGSATPEAGISIRVKQLWISHIDALQESGGTLRRFLGAPCRAPGPFPPHARVYRSLAVQVSPVRTAVQSNETHGSDIRPLFLVFDMNTTIDGTPDVSILPNVSDEHLAKWPWGLSFQMLQCPTPTVAWSNRRLPYQGGDEGLLHDFAWQIPTVPRAAWPDTPRKTFYAECYGGEGIHHNGGGVRGAWSGNWLVKGTGINLLSGYSDEVASGYRRNGRASLCEMLIEAIWGEVLHYALPYGAVRMTAVIRTGETLDSAAEPTGALGVREFTLRPAQFMRAPAFQVRPENRALVPHDTERVKKAIAQLHALLPMPEALAPTDVARLKPLRRLTIGLEEMVRRFGEQMAAAKAKRISHGTLTTSNIALDGRWNDLNTVCALPSYGYRSNLTPFWQEQFSPLKIIDLLCFYIRKYYPAVSGEQPEAMPTKEWLAAAYEKFYTDALHRRFVALCGYPQNVANRIWATQDGQSAMRRLADTLVSLGRSGHSHRRPYEDAMHENRVFGDYHLMKILKRMATCRSAAARQSMLESLICDQKLRNEFRLQYRVVEKMMFKESKRQGIASQCFARLVTINCYKAGQHIPLLFRNLLYAKCRQIAEGHMDPQDIRKQAEAETDVVVDQARMVYQEPRNFKTLLWCSGKSTLEYDARTDSLSASTASTNWEASCSPAEREAQTKAGIGPLLNSMKEYWGNNYEEMMQ